ncbi:MAG TPA: hypothetical protein VIN56_03270 [Candidatus Dormibacteraeota bacterium]|jgi:CBS-domain-containing membrane protein
MSPRAAWRLEALGFEQVYDYVAGETDWAAAGLPVEGTVTKVPTIGNLVHADVPTCRRDEPLADVVERTSKGGWNTCVVTNEHGIVLGRLFRKELESGATGTAESVMRAGPSTYRPNVDVLQMTTHMTERKLETALLTTSDGRLLGLVRRAEIAAAAAEIGGHDHHDH